MATRIDVLRAQRLMKRGAVLVDVLPASIFIQEHLPSAESLPLETLDDDAVADMDRGRATIAYCFDQH